MKKALSFIASVLTASALTVSAFAADYANIQKIGNMGGNYDTSMAQLITTDITARDSFFASKYSSLLSKDQINQLTSLDRYETKFLFDLTGDMNEEYIMSVSRQNAMLSSPSILDMNNGLVNFYIYSFSNYADNRFYLIPAQDDAFGVSVTMTITSQMLNSGLTSAGIPRDAELELFYENGDGRTLGSVCKLPRDAAGNVSFPIEYGYTYYIAAQEAAVTDEELEEIIEEEIKDAMGLTDAELAQHPTMRDYVDHVTSELAATIPDQADITAVVRDYLSDQTNLAKLAEDMGFADGEDGLSAYELAVKEGYNGTLAEWLASLAGTDGAPGLSAYEIAVAKGFVGTEEQWLASLEGEDGDDGKSAYEIAVENGFKGTLKEWLESLEGNQGTAGLSAYEIAVKNGFKGTEAQWIASLSGEDGQDFSEWVKATFGTTEAFLNAIRGKSAYELAYEKDKTIGTEAQWLASLQGKNGLSAYEVAVLYGGYKGSMAQWLASLQGKDGLSAYALAVEDGFDGDLTEWLESLKGEDGEDGQDGEDGEDGQDGRDGRDGRDGQVVYVNAGAGNGGTTGGSTGGITNGNVTGGTSNPKTGLAAGIIIPVASLASLIIYKKGGKKRRK